MRIPFMKHVAWYLVAAMFLIGIAPKVEAGLAPSKVMTMTQVDRASDLDRIQKVIEMKMVSERLEKYGLTKDEIQQRLNALSDQQIHKMATQLDDLKIGGSDALGIVVALLVIMILIIFLVWLTGHRVVVTDGK